MNQKSSLEFTKQFREKTSLIKIMKNIQCHTWDAAEDGSWLLVMSLLFLHIVGLLPAVPAGAGGARVLRVGPAVLWRLDGEGQPVVRPGQRHVHRVDVSGEDAWGRLGEAVWRGRVERRVTWPRSSYTHITGQIGNGGRQNRKKRTTTNFCLQKCIISSE